MPFFLTEHGANSPCAGDTVDTKKTISVLFLRLQAVHSLPGASSLLDILEDIQKLTFTTFYFQSPFPTII